MSDTQLIIAGFVLCFFFLLLVNYIRLKWVKKKAIKDINKALDTLSDLINQQNVGEYEPSKNNAIQSNKLTLQNARDGLQKLM